MAADSFVTVRVVETAAEPFKWEKPVKDDWMCVTVISENFGDFNTGLVQFVY